jgi:hypothetical protein
MGFVTGAQNFDVVSLGDVVTDEFIRLPEGAVHVRVDDDGRWLEIPLGTKLVIEDDSLPATGGSAANAAVAMARLGLRVGLASYLAHDQIGLDMLSAMRGEDVDTSLIHVDSPSHTVRNFVLTLGAERTILVRHADFNYKWKGFRDYEVPRRTRRLVGQFPERTTGLPTRHLPVGGGYQTTRSSLRQSRIAPLQPCRRQYHHWYFLERLEAPSR